MVMRLKLMRSDSSLSASFSALGMLRRPIASAASVRISGSLPWATFSSTVPTASVIGMAASAVTASSRSGRKAASSGWTVAVSSSTAGATLNRPAAHSSFCRQAVRRSSGSAGGSLPAPTGWLRFCSQALRHFASAASTSLPASAALVPLRPTIFAANCTVRASLLSSAFRAAATGSSRRLITLRASSSLWAGLQCGSISKMRSGSPLSHTRFSGSRTLCPDRCLFWSRA